MNATSVAASIWVSDGESGATTLFHRNDKTSFTERCNCLFKVKKVLKSDFNVCCMSHKCKCRFFFTHLLIFLHLLCLNVRPNWSSLRKSLYESNQSLLVKKDIGKCYYFYNLVFMLHVNYRNKQTLSKASIFIHIPSYMILLMHGQISFKVLWIKGINKFNMLFYYHHHLSTFFCYEETLFG